MKCMSCLGVVVRLNSFRGFNLAHMVEEKKKREMEIMKRINNVEISN